jgi:hypothetical protein
MSPDRELGEWDPRGIGEAGLWREERAGGQALQFFPGVSTEQQEGMVGRQDRSTHSIKDEYPVFDRIGESSEELPVGVRL